MALISNIDFRKNYDENSSGGSSRGTSFASAFDSASIAQGDDPNPPKTDFYSNVPPGQSDKDKSLIPLIDYTDPLVLHDSGYQGPGIAKKYEPQNAFNAQDNTVGTIEPYSNEKVEGIYFPIIKVNNKVLDYKEIDMMKIFYTGFTPSMVLRINDPNLYTQTRDIPLMNNEIVVKILPMLNGAYKAITLQFYIESSSLLGSQVTFNCSFRYMPFKKKYIREVVYKACPNKDCTHADNIRPNTWELLHVLALESGLGFAATDKCRTIQDRLPRIMKGQTIPEFIEKQMEFSGLDADSIFDAWVDLYGYIIMVNLSYVLFDPITYRHLSIVAECGIHTTDEHPQSKTKNSPERKFQGVHRTITNFSTMGVPSNIEIEEYHSIVRNDIITQGATKTIHMFEIQGNGKDYKNQLNTEQTEIRQDTISGDYAEDYITDASHEFMFEFTNRDLQIQKTIRSSFLEKKRNNILEVTLRDINLGFQRGTLVNVMIYENDPASRLTLLSATDNIIGKKDIHRDQVNVGRLTVKDTVTTDNAPITNLSLSGLYYIDGMRFEYDARVQKTKQILIMFKKGRLDNINNFNTSPRVDETKYPAKPTLPQSPEYVLPA